MAKKPAKIQYDTKYLASQLLKARLELNLNKAEAAAKIGIPASNYHMYETEKVVRPSDAFIDKACAAYNKPRDFFAKSLNDSESMIPKEVKDWMFTTEAEPFIIAAYAQYAASVLREKK